MTDKIKGVPYWRWTFDKTGGLQNSDRPTAVSEATAEPIEHLFVFAHGWNNDTEDAENLFQSMFGLMANAAAGVPALNSIGFAGVFWPSIWFPEPPPALQAEVAAATQAGSPGAADGAVSGAAIAASLAPSFADPRQQAAITAMGNLIDDGLAGVDAGRPAAQQQTDLAQFHDHLQTVFGGAISVAEEDGGEASLVQSTDPEADYQKIADAMGSVPAGGDAQGLGDIFGKVWNGAKDALRVGSYLEMKSRAGTVGKTGLGPLLQAIHLQDPSIRVHLIGHSFGARLVSFALSGIDNAQDSPVFSVSLIQGAFSHWAFADQNPFGTPGALHAYRDRISGPLMSTFTPHDWAVGFWYPKASFLAGDDASALVGDPSSRWGGIGADGVQDVPGPPQPTQLGAGGTHYGFAARNYYRVDSTAIIADTRQSPFAGAHSDILHPEVAWLPLCAAAQI